PLGLVRIDATLFHALGIGIAPRAARLGWQRRCRCAGLSQQAHTDLAAASCRTLARKPVELGSRTARVVQSAPSRQFAAPNPLCPDLCCRGCGYWLSTGQREPWLRLEQLPCPRYTIPLGKRVGLDRRLLWCRGGR